MRRLILFTALLFSIASSAQVYVLFAHLRERDSDSPFGEKNAGHE